MGISLLAIGWMATGLDERINVTQKLMAVLLIFKEAKRIVSTADEAYG